MGNRLTKIYTRTGDDGTAGLADGSRVAKDAALIEAIGDVDELNACLGVVLSHNPGEPCRLLLTQLQHQLFDIGSELSCPEIACIDSQNINWLESKLDFLNQALPPLKEFILPGGGPAAAACHVARTVCRRAERRLVALRREDAELNPWLQVYLNRLSDLLFVLCRMLAHEVGQPEVYWQSKRLESD